MSKKKVIKEVAKEAPKEVGCEVIVETAGGTHRGEGSTFEEAFLNIPVEFIQIKHKGVIKLRQGPLAWEHFYPVTLLRRMLATKIARVHWANMLSKFLK